MFSESVLTSQLLLKDEAVCTNGADSPALKLELLYGKYGNGS